MKEKVFIFIDEYYRSFFNARLILLWESLSVLRRTKYEVFVKAYENSPVLKDLGGEKE